MIIPHRPRSRRTAALLLLVAGLGACTDGTPLSPTIEPGPTAGLPALQCVVDVPSETMTCTVPTPEQTRLSVAANRLVGGQDVLVKLSSSGTGYDEGTQTFRTTVTVQNLLARPLGTVDGTTVNGVTVFFHSGPTVSAGGSGEVTVKNPTGVGFFTAANQPYFLYPQILQPYEISAPITWEFNAPPTARRFTFVVYVSAPQANENLPLLDRVWLGTADSSWTNPANWQGGLVPDSGSTVAVPPDSLMQGSFMPVLAGDAALSYLRVGGGSTLDLAGRTLTAWGNVDAPGTISSGLVRMGAQNSVLRGTVPAVQVTGGVRLQGATRAAGPVTVSGGSLTASGESPLTISVP
jgi:hypothetical protein